MPSLVNGWQILRNLAKQHNTTLTHQYILSLIRNQGVGLPLALFSRALIYLAQIWIIPKHFIPPMLVNAMLGTILWTSYAEANRRLEGLLGHHALANAVLSGGIAGACQAIAGAPAENVRMILEHGFGGESWFCVWKEVFKKRAVHPRSQGISERHRNIRYLRSWLKEVGEMAGRGWNGWAWGCGSICLSDTSLINKDSRWSRMLTCVDGISHDCLFKFFKFTNSPKTYCVPLPCASPHGDDFEKHHSGVSEPDEDCR